MRRTKYSPLRKTKSKSKPESAEGAEAAEGSARQKLGD
jgi:hypothetical protein